MFFRHGQCSRPVFTGAGTHKRPCLLIQLRVQHERFFFRLKFATIDIDVARSNNFISNNAHVWSYTQRHTDVKMTSYWRHTALHGPWTRAVNTGVKNYARVHGPCSRPVNTDSVYRHPRTRPVNTGVFLSPVFTARVHGPWARVVCIGLCIENIEISIRYRYKNLYSP